MRRIVALFALALLAHPPVHAAGTEQPGARKPEVVNRVRPGEPMPGQMKRKGMKKEAVHDEAMKKDALMRDAMKKEAPPRK